MRMPKVMTILTGPSDACALPRKEGTFSGRPATRGGLHRALASGLFLLLCLGTPLARGQTPGETAWLDLEMKPETRELVQGQLVATLNGTAVGLLPATVLLPAASASDPHELRLSTLDGAHVFVFRVAVDGGRVLVLDARADACKAIKVQAVALRQGMRWRLRIDLSNKLEADCRGSHVAAATSERVKIRFESAPDGAEIYYPESSGPGKEHTYDVRFKGKTARTLAVGFVPGDEVTVFFKKPGFQDGVARFRMEQDDQGKWLVLGASRLPLGRVKKDRDAPVVSAILQPFPATQ
jgi:hypothetical protein